MTAFLDQLAGAGDVVTDLDVLGSYRRDQAAPGLLAAGMPAALVRPRTTAEVQVAIRAAATHDVAIVPRGAGSGLSGGANALDGCLLLCLERMTDVVELDPASLVARVQPGVINQTLRDLATGHGLWYAPDPASAEFSTLGGNIATNAGGLCCVKYGVTRVPGARALTGRCGADSITPRAATGEGTRRRRSPSDATRNGRPVRSG